MTKEKSSISGGRRVTEHVKTSNIFGDDRSYTRTKDYNDHGTKTSEVKTDHNGNQWKVVNGVTTEKIGNDGRNKR